MTKQSLEEEPHGIEPFDADRSLPSADALRASEEKYRTLSEAIEEGFAIADVILDDDGEGVDYRILEANARFEHLTGMSREEFLSGRTVREILPSAGHAWARTLGRVAVRGESVRFESHFKQVDRWFEVYVFRIGDPSLRRVASLYNDITTRRRAEQALRDSEKIQAYLLRLSDVLRPIASHTEIMAAAPEVLARELAVSIAGYVEMSEDGDSIVMGGQYADGRMPEVQGPCRFSDFGDGIESTLAAGQEIFMPDIYVDPRGPSGGSEKTKSFKIRSVAAIPLIKEGRLVALFYAAHFEPRTWERWEQEIIRQTAERTWAAVERARAESAQRESEEKHRALFNLMDQGFAVMEVLYNESGVPWNLRFVEVNPAFIRRIGVSDPVGKTSRELIPNLEDSCLQTYGRVAETGESVRFESYSHDSGRWLDIFASRVGGAGSRMISVIFDDITERKRSEAALRESEERYRSLFDWIDQGFTVLELLYDENGSPSDLRFVATNRVFEKQTGFTDYLGKTARQLNPNLEDEWVQIYAGVIETRKSIRFERYVREIGRWFDIFASPLGPEGSRLLNVVFDDVTARKQAEAAVRESEERKAYLLRLSDAIRSLSDPVEIQETASRLLGEYLRTDRAFYSKRDEALSQLIVEREYARAGTPSLVGRYPLEAWAWIDESTQLSEPTVINDVHTSQLIPDDDRDVILGTGVSAFVCVPMLKDVQKVGALCVACTEPRVWTEPEIALVRDTADRTWAAVEHARAEAALRDSEERFRLLLENVHEYALVRLDTELRFASWNPGAERIFGYSSPEILGQPFSLLLSQEDQAGGIPCMALTDMERSGRTEDARWLVHKDGRRIWTRWVTEPIRNKEGHVIGLTKVLRDETERLKTETSLRQSEKLAVVGRMASSIAHEINNPLEAVVNLMYLARSCEISPEAGALLQQAEHELARVSHIATATLHFHRQASEPAEVDVKEILESTLLLHEGRLKATQIATERRYKSHPTIYCLANEIRQVFANLVSNSIDAMSKNTDPRRLVVRIGKSFDPKSGEAGVRVMIADTGSGIRESAKKQVFEPFFTTKTATGTGLGLWISAESVKKHHGTIRFRSRTAGKYRGTVFSVFLGRGNRSEASDTARLSAADQLQPAAHPLS